MKLMFPQRYAVVILSVILARSFIAGYEVHVEVEDNDGTVQKWDYTEELSTYHLNIENNDDDGVEQMQQRSRVRRKAAKSKHLHYNCVNRLPKLQDEQRQRALVADYGGKTILPCHYCDEAKKKILASHVWYKFHRELDVVTGQILWHAKEVELDMHDVENLNRVYAKPGHELVIKDFQPNDKGTYLCAAYKKSAEKGKKFAFRSQKLDTTSAISMGLVWADVTDDYNIEFIFHVDIVLPIKAKLVTHKGTWYPEPAAPIKNVKKNYMISTKWENWGPCSNCGTQGKRKRKGRCVVTHIKSNKTSTSASYMDYVLQQFPAGAACHSSLFVNVPQIIKYPQEIEVAKCKKKCPSKTSSFFRKKVKLYNKQSLMERIQIKTAPKKSKVVKASIKKNQGDEISLACPGANSDKVVEWQKGSKAMDAEEVAKETDGRIEVDTLNRLRIYNATVKDSATYTCQFDKKKIAVYKVKVKGVIVKEDLLLHLMYLGMTYVADLALFLFLLMIKLCTRIVQVRRKHAAAIHNTARPSSRKHRHRSRRKKKKKKRKSKSPRFFADTSSSVSDEEESADDAGVVTVQPTGAVKDAELSPSKTKTSEPDYIDMAAVIAPEKQQANDGDARASTKDKITTKQVARGKRKPSETPEKWPQTTKSVKQNSAEKGRANETPGKSTTDLNSVKQDSPRKVNDKPGQVSKNINSAKQDSPRKGKAKEKPGQAPKDNYFIDDGYVDMTQVKQFISTPAKTSVPPSKK